MSINNVTIVGRLTKDVELKYTPSGVPMVRFTVAVNRTFADQSGERKADFINCIAWRKQAENIANFMRKGSLVGVSGRIETGSYEGQDGKRVYTTDVIAENVQFLEPRNDGQTQQQPNAPQSQYQAPQQQQQSYQQQPQQQTQYQQPPQQNNSRVNDDPFANSKGPIEVSEDDLPF